MYRYLQGNRGNSVPRRVVCFDTETREYTCQIPGGGRFHKLRLGCAERFRWRDGAAGGSETLDFRWPQQFWAWLLAGSRARETTYLFAHSLLFDLRMAGFVELLDDGGWTIDKPRVPRDPDSTSAANRGGRALAVIQAPPTIFCLRHIESGCKVIALDTLNWLRVPLRSIGEAVGLPKLPMPPFADCDRNWFDYCRRDVEIVSALVKWLIAWVERRGLGNFGKTIAQQASNAFRHRFLRHKIVLHDETDVQSLERSGYFGGRCECFRLGEIRARTHQYDVNALYPAMMHFERYPRRLLRWETREDFLPLAPACDPRRSIARVLIQPREAVYPHRTKRGTCYPLYMCETTLCGPELARAAKRGEIKGWGSWAEYELAPIFRLAAGTLWKWRREAVKKSDVLEAQLTKLLANAMYGKFGQRQVQWIDDALAIAPHPWHQWIELAADGVTRTACRSFGWHVQRQTDQGNVSGAFVAIAAFVTAHAREHMNSLRAIAGARNVYYQAVDSLLVSDAGRHNLVQAGKIASGVLGALRHQTTVPFAEVRGINDYTLATRDIIAGVSSKAQRLAAGHYREQRFFVGADLFTSYNVAGVRTATIETERDALYWKGKVQNDGWIKPLEIAESEGSEAT